MQQLTCERQAGASVAVRQQPVVVDAVEATGQHVQQKAAHELARIERHCLVARAALVAVVLPPEGHAALIKRDEPAVGDGHPVRVARQVRQHRLGAGERALGVDHPLALALRCQPAGERRCVRQRRLLTEELQPAIAMRLLQRFEETPAELAAVRRQSLDRAEAASDEWRLSAGSVRMGCGRWSSVGSVAEVL